MLASPSTLPSVSVSSTSSRLRHCRSPRLSPVARSVATEMPKTTDTAALGVESVAMTIRPPSALQVAILGIVGSFLDFLAKTIPFKVSKLPIRAPEPWAPRRPSTTREMDDALMALDAAKDEWVQTSMRERASLLRECIKLVRQQAMEFGELHEKYKGTYGEGRGIMAAECVPLINALAMYARGLESGFREPFPSLHKLPTGQTAVGVFPFLPHDPLVMGPGTAEVWVREGRPVTRAALYQQKSREGPGKGAVSLVLGAGNQMTIGIFDALHQLIAEDHVVLIKMNPVNDYLGPWYEKVLAPLVERDWIRIAYGGAEAGQYLVSHKLVDAVHLTGSQATHDAIVWGPGASKTGKPRLAKPVTAELGNVTPMVIVPGDWTEAEMEYWAEMVVFAKYQNAGHNCAAAEVLVTDRSWPLRTRFLAKVKAAFQRYPSRWCFYPGSDKNVQLFQKTFPDCQSFHASDAAQGTSPLLFAEGLTEDECRGATESWCTALQEVALDKCASVDDFLKRAVRFCNDRLYGTLACSLVCDGRTERANEAAVERAIAELRYGAVCVNHAPLMGYGVLQLPWGAWDAGRGNDLADIGTGAGFVHNALMLEDVEKGVLRCPFIIKPNPVVFPRFRNFHGIAQPAVALAAGDQTAAVRLIMNVLRG